MASLCAVRLPIILSRQEKGGQLKQCSKFLSYGNGDTAYESYEGKPTPDLEAILEAVDDICTIIEYLSTRK